MLVLSRREGESIVVGEGPTAVRVTVLAVGSGNKVRLGLAGPREVPIVRGELPPLPPLPPPLRAAAAGERAA